MTDAELNGHIERASLWCLAANLTIAAALCRAYDLGENPPSLGPSRHVHTLPSGIKVWESTGYWRPGCNRPAPGAT